MKAGNKNIHECAYCGKTKDLTRDHVFSRGFFNKPYPKDNIIVPACKQCNNVISKDEEFFRTLLAARATFTEDGKKLWREKVLGSSFKRSPKFKSYITKMLGRDSLYTNSGIYLGDIPVLKLGNEENRRINNVIGKVVKGLYAFHFDKRLTDDIELMIRPIEIFSEFWNEYFKNFVLHQVGDNTVKYKYGFLEVNNKLSTWGILFYNRIMFFVITYPHKMKSILFPKKK